MVGVNFSSSRILTSVALAACLALGAVETFAQTYYWNPVPAGGDSLHKSSNWTSQQNGSGARALSPKDDDFADTTMGPWEWIDSVPGTPSTSTKSFTTTPGKITITAKGEDIWIGANQFAGIYRKDYAPGDFDVTVKVESQTRADPWSKAGILIANDFTRMGAGGVFSVLVTPDNGFVAHWDSTDVPTFGYPSSAPGRLDAGAGGVGIPSAYPCWLRATRVGNVVTGYYKTTSINNPWIQIKASNTSQNTSAAVPSQIGLVVTSHNVGLASTAVFDDFEGGGTLSSMTLDLNFGGTGTTADAPAAVRTGFQARSVNFTNYSGTFSFGGSALTLTGDAFFSSTMAITPNTGRLILAATSGTQQITPKVNATLPSIWKTGGGKALVVSNPLRADSLWVESGSFDLGSLNAHIGQFTAAGGTLEGLTATDDTLFIYDRAAFGGLQTFTPGIGVVAIKSVGDLKTASFDPGGKTFANVTLWTVPTGGGDAFVQVGPGALITTGDLVFRSQRAALGFDGVTSFPANPNVTVGGNITQVIDGATGANWYPIQMGNGTWSVNGNVAFSLSGGSADNSTLDLTRASGFQTLGIAGGPLNEVRHAAAGTVTLGAPLNAKNLSLTAGSLNLNGNNLTLSGNLTVDGGVPALLAGLAGRSLTVGGNASFAGRAGNALSLNPASVWSVKVTGNFTADHVSVANSDASGGTAGVAGANGVDQGGNINWSFGGAPPNQLPAITTQPKDTTVIEGGSASFSVAVTGTVPLTFTWKRDTTTVGSGATLNLANVTLGMNGGNYRCIISNTVGSVTSAPAKLTVNKAPVAAKVTVEPVDQLAQAGKSATFSFTAVGDAPLAYAWYRKGEAAVLASTPNLTLTGLVLAQDTTYYYCIVSNALGADTTREALLNVVPQPVPALITSEPKDTTVFVTEKASFTVVASGSDPIAYQWRKKGPDTTAVGTDPVLSVASASLAQDGYYFCIVSNAYGRDTTREARFTVKPPPVAPTIIREPSDTLVKVGAKASFSVGVLGSAPLAFEWRSKVDTAVLSRDSIFTIAAVTESHSGSSYYVVVSNSTGVKDTSSEAHLTVRTCDSLSIQVSPDVTANEGQNVSLFGKAVCADRIEWSIVSGPAPRLLDPGVDTLSFKAPRVSGDTAIRYLFSAFFGETVKTQAVAVKVKESIPDPSMALTVAQVTWSGAKPLALKPTIYNKAQLDLFTGYPLRYVWALAPALSDSASAGDSLTLKDPSGDGRMDVVLCMDNGGKAACDTVRVDIDRNQVALLPRGARLMEGLSISGPWLTWSRPGVVRIWTWNGRLLFESRGLAGTTALIPPSALGAWRGRAARLVFTP